MSGRNVQVERRKHIKSEGGRRAGRQQKQKSVSGWRRGAEIHNRTASGGCGVAAAVRASVTAQRLCSLRRAAGCGVVRRQAVRAGVAVTWAVMRSAAARRRADRRNSLWSALSPPAWSNWRHAGVRLWLTQCERWHIKSAGGGWAAAKTKRSAGGGVVRKYIIGRQGGVGRRAYESGVRQVGRLRDGRDNSRERPSLPGGRGGGGVQRAAGGGQKQKSGCGVWKTFGVT